MIVRATADNQNQLRFTAEHQPALHRDGAWVGESGPRSSVTHSRQVQWVRLPVACYQARFTKYAKDMKIKDERKAGKTSTLR